MIYTVTLNPSIDYVITLDALCKGAINRTKEEDIIYGGKGINVSMMLAHLGIPSTALGFFAGFTGEALKKGIEQQGIMTDFIPIEDGFTRINVKIHAQEESEINGQGPLITSAHLHRLYAKLELLQPNDILVLSGNLPKQVPANIYAVLMEKLHDKQIDVVVDAFGEPLRQALPQHPFLIKPNHHELQELFQLADLQEQDLVTCARQLQMEGARNVIISMADKGAMLVSETNEVYRIASPKGKVVNSVGAGDSMVAGFLYGWLKEKTYEKALRWGVACGSASAFCKGIAQRAFVMEQYQKMEDDLL